MDLTVRLFAVLRERAGTGELALSGLPEPLTVGGLKAELERRHPELGSLRHTAGVIGTDYVGDDALVEPGAAVALLPPVSGGAGESHSRVPASEDAPVAPVRPDYGQGVFELRSEELDAADAARRVRDDGCGAVVTFVGATRDTNRGRRVERLEYEAFESMTGPEMARIFAACRAELDGERPERRLRMLCQHRVGTVLVGEPSVVIAVASPHRDAAFAACRFLIDRLKETLPIWKREVYADGHCWIGDRS